MIFTFYSYKGGVGRSMAMANVADALARRGLRVAMIDFDLEAPGLEEYFPVDHGGVRQHRGLLDLLLAYKRAMSGTGPEDAFTRLDDFIFPVYPRLPGGGVLDLLPAGRRGDAAALSRYATELQRFDWQDFFFNWAGSRLFEWLRRKLGKRYDVVLVDSRTGVTEMGGVCAYQLADVIVAVCAANRQNVDGTASTLADFTSARVRAQRADRSLQIVVVPSRVEIRAEAELARFKDRFEAAFDHLAPPDVRFWDLLIPYEPSWAFDEATAGRIDARGGASPVYQPLTEVLLRLAGRGVVSGPLAEPPEATRALMPFAHDDADEHGDATAVEAPPPPAPAPTGRPTAPTPIQPHPPPLAPPTVETPHAQEAVPTKTSPEPGTEPSQTQATRISFDPTRTAAPPDALLVHAADAMEAARSLEQSLRGMGVRAQRLAVPAQAPSEWADLNRFATRATHRVLLYDPAALGRAGQRLADVAEAPVVRVNRDDADPIAGLHQALVGTPPPEADAVARAVAAALQPPIDDSSQSGDGPVQNPYVGHRAFDEEDAGWFFGRSRDVEAILTALRRGRVVTVLGPSGVGKSSLIRAGLAPEIRAGALGRSFRVAQIKASPDLALTSALRALQAGGEGPLLLVVDDAERLPIPAIEALVAEAGDDLRLVLTLQSTHPQIAHGEVIRLKPLGRPEMHQAMLGAADRAGVGLEEGLAERILDDLEQVATPLSALQAILRDLFAQRRQGWLTHAAYAHSGHASGQTGADAAERVFIDLDEAGRDTARALFLRLVTADGELRTVEQAQLPTGAPVEAFVHARVLWAGARADGTPAWRISDARLPGRWSRLGEWLSVDADFIRWLDFVHTASQAGTVVLTWDELARAEDYARERTLTPAEHGFLASVRAWEEQTRLEAVERDRRKRWVLAGAAALLAGIVFLGLWSFRAAGEAERSQSVAAVMAESARLDTELDRDDARLRAAERYADSKARGDAVGQALFGASLAQARIEEGAVAEAAEIVAAVEARLPELEATNQDVAASTRRRLAETRERLADAGWYKALRERLRRARFVLVLDIEALIDLDHPSDRAAACPQEVPTGPTQTPVEITRVTVGEQTVILRPDWDSLCQRIWEGDGQLLLMVPQRTVQAEALVAALRYQDRPFSQTPWFAGIIGQAEVGWLADEPDLLPKLMLVAREIAFPPRNLRTISGFEADGICGGVPEEDPGAELRRLTWQIDESLGAGGPFAEAFIPYTAFGWPRLATLTQDRKLSPDDARALLRRTETGRGVPRHQYLKIQDQDERQIPAPAPTPERPIIEGLRPPPAGAALRPSNPSRPSRPKPTPTRQTKPKPF